MKIRTKILVLLSILSLFVVVIVAIITISGLGEIRKTITNMAKQNEESIQLNLTENLQNAQDALVNEGMADVDVFVEEAQEKFITHIKNIKVGKKGFIYIYQLDNSDKVKKIYNSGTIALSKTNDFYYRTFKTKGRMNIIEANSEYYVTYDYFPAWNWQVCVFNNASEIYSCFDDIKKVFVNNIYVIILTIIVAIVVLFTLIARNIIKPVLKVSAYLEDIANGNFNIKVKVTSKDEIGKMVENLKRMVEKISDIVLGVINASKQIDLTSKQMNSYAQLFANRASEQASSVEEVSSSMEEIAANIQQNADNSRQTETISLSASKGIKDGYESTEVTVNSMKDIAQKISIINDIAFQTNILALNAAVEAARAGEYGKGFAVVAAEVRKLAESSKTAGEEIVELSKSGVEISEKAGKQLSEMVPEIEKTASLVQEITMASLEQNSGIEQINKSMQLLNETTQENATVAEDMSKNAKEMADLAEQLNEIISFFRLQDDQTKQHVEQQDISMNEGETQRIKHTTKDKQVVTK